MGGRLASPHVGLDVEVASADVANQRPRDAVDPSVGQNLPFSPMSLSPSLTPSVLIEQLRLLEGQIPVCSLFSNEYYHTNLEAASRTHDFTG